MGELGRKRKEGESKGADAASMEELGVEYFGQ